MNIHSFVLLVNVFATYGRDSNTDKAISMLYQNILDEMVLQNEQIPIVENAAIKEIQPTVKTAVLAESDKKHGNGTNTEQSSSNTTRPIICGNHQNGQDSTWFEDDMTRLEQSISMVYRGISAEKSARIKNTQSISRLEANVTEDIKDLKDETIVINKRLTELSDKFENIVVLDKKIQPANDNLDGSNLSMESLSNKLVTLYTAMRMIMLKINGNLALNKPAIQSSSLVGTANAATDGNKDGHWDSGSCTHTNNQTNPWWRVDLEDLFFINKVVIQNRQDCCGHRLHDFTLTVSKTNDGEEVLCGKYKGPSTNGAIETILCAPDVMGRFLKIQINGTFSVLTLCEVEVYGLQPDMNL